MKAVAYQNAHPITHPQALIDIELAKPVASGTDILVNVEAISVNPVDTKVRSNVTPTDQQYKILGWDAVGTVESVGEQVTLFKPGDKVWYAGAINRQGANCEYHLVDQRIVALAPKNLSCRDAAAMPLTSITAWEMLFDRFNLNSESSGTLLIIGAAGGVGSIMIQLARQLTNLTIIATASRPETQSWVRELGADYVINHSHNLEQELHSIGLDNVNYIASLTHTEEHFADIATIIAPQGKLGVIDDAATLDIMPLKRKSVSIHWELMFTRSLFETEDMIEQHKLLTRVANMVDQGKLKSTIANEFGTINAQNLIKAHALLESGKSKGKIVLSGF